MKALKKDDDVVVYIQSLLNEGFSLPYYNIAHLLETYHYNISEIYFAKPSRKEKRLTLKSIKEVKNGVEVTIYEESWADYLPLVYRNDTLESFLYGFQLSMFKQIAVIDNVEELFTPEKTPEPFVQWLASWFNISFSEKIKLKNRRRIIYKLTDLYNKKGTKEYLIEMVQLLTDITIDIKERELLESFSTTNKNFSFVVTIKEEPAYIDAKERNLMHQIVKNIIENEKPIFTKALFDDSFELNSATIPIEQTSSELSSTPPPTTTQIKEEIIVEEPIIKEKEILFKEKKSEEKEEKPEDKSGYDDFF